MRFRGTRVSRTLSNWQAMRESNPRHRFWRPKLYHLTNRPFYIVYKEPPPKAAQPLAGNPRHRFWRPKLYHLTNRPYYMFIRNLRQRRTSLWLGTHDKGFGDPCDTTSPHPHSK